MAMLKDKVVLITGCSSEIGLSTVHAYSSAGAKVFGCDIQQPPAEISTFPNFLFHSCDVSKQADIDATVEACLRFFDGRIDVLLNVAGVSDQLGSVDTLDDSQYNRVVDIDLTGPIKLMRAMIPYMRKQKSGSIVNVSSKTGLGGASGGVAYTAAKHGLNVAWRYHRKGVRCIAICPGGMRKIHQPFSQAHAYEQTETTGSLDQKNGPIANGPIGLEEIANVLVFLGSDLSSAINGVALPVDKAWSYV
ncbi:hypothetical protein COCVIDRAFT_40446 [Bipolaris victoriae FI3]|uniref:Oxidoreductase n=1 Tax=Bipolaris victoriae (strain FI3) TaxID=930091 RepID=W7EDT1_BIPV3|nr:hypothetical protein COCVIDRAFT_40446 [Bipolaris victoriae FI3]